MADYCKLLDAGILCSSHCPPRLGHDVPVNLQPGTCYSLFCNFLSSVCMKTVTSLRSNLEGRVLRKGYHVYFSQKAVLFYYLRQRCKARKTKNKQESTKGSAKGMYPTWSQVCYSLLQ